jgi:hypothetical protein
LPVDAGDTAAPRPPAEARESAGPRLCTAVATRARVRSSRLLAITISALLAHATGCMTDDAGDGAATDEVSAPDGESDGKADAAAELRVRAGDTTLWVQPTLVRTATAWQLHGRLSRNFVDGFGFVFDDPFGDVAKLSARTFEVAYGLTSSGPLLDGVNLFVSLTVQGGAGHVTARAVVRPRLVEATGSSKITLTAEVTPVVMDGRPVFRVKGRTTAAATAVSSSAGQARLIDATHFAIDLSRDDLIALAGATTRLDIGATLAGGGPAVVRHAKIALSVKTLSLTTGDVYELFPVPTCTPAVTACLTALPAGALDLAGCGDAITTQACRGQVGVQVDGAAIAASLAGADATLADPAGFAADAVGLVGADHADALRAALHTDVSARLDAMGGRWYLAAATRAARLAAVVTDAFDHAYARPLALVPAHAPIAGDAARTRQVVADGLLAYLLTTDYAHTDFERSYDQLTKDFRTQHVASVRGFRETEDIFHDPSKPTEAIYLGQWLGAHTEVTVDVTTGAVTHVLVELD